MAKHHRQNLRALMLTEKYFKIQFFIAFNQTCIKKILLPKYILWLYKKNCNRYIDCER